MQTRIVVTFTMSPAERAEALGWLDDCFRGDYEYDGWRSSRRTDAEIARMVNVHWDGGWDDFVAAGMPR